MLEWLFGKSTKKLEEETKRSFSSVKSDISGVLKWLKHLDNKDKQLFDVVNELKQEMSSINDELTGLREAIDLAVGGEKNKPLFKKMGVYGKQTAVCDVQEGVQTAVQTGNFYDILRGLTSNERLLVFTLLNAGEGMKMSYEDLALVLGKERATVRGQINSIKQKNEGLIEEIIEKNGKKRVFVRPNMREKLSKYAKVRVRKKVKSNENYAE
ncbi:hypothetical protein J4217_03445 [Candidatus Pacearchaeota archaeon]|nr:hypothetical protein [Candidatus Pacearchaeota archaeon]